MKYRSGYIALNSDIDNKYQYAGKYFNFSFKKPKSRNCTIANGKELIIETANDVNAIKVSRLVSASITLLDSHYNSLTSNRPTIYVYDSNNDSRVVEKSNMEIMSTIDIPLACKIACKASFRKKHYYSLFKYHLACTNLHSNISIDLEPFNNGQDAISPFPDDHIRLGYAIVLFYSIIEELGLEIRASSINPSKFNDGQWNPNVKNNLETRLLKANIDIDKNILWIKRNKPTVIEKRKKPNTITKTEWAYGQIRDSKISIIEAILIVSWIRSKIVSHKVDEAIKSVSIFDVSNANLLSRRLLLETLGYWNIH